MDLRRLASNWPPSLARLARIYPTMDLNYARTGNGEPLVLLHQLGGSTLIWEPVIERLAAERDVIAVDMPGFGDSPGLPGGTAPDPEALAGAVAGFLDSLGISRAHAA